MMTVLDDLTVNFVAILHGVKSCDTSLHYFTVYTMPLFFFPYCLLSIGCHNANPKSHFGLINSY